MASLPWLALKRGDAVELIRYAGNNSVSNEDLPASAKLICGRVLWFRKAEANDVRRFLLRFLVTNRRRRRGRKTDDVS